MMTNNKPQRWLLFLVTLTVTAGLFWWWSSRPVTVYNTEPLATGNIEAVVAAIGTVEPRDSVNVGVQVSGQITYLHVKPGDTVEKGQLLAEIDASVLEAVVDAGRAELAMLKAQLQERQAQVTLASQQHKRQQRLFVDGATPEEEVQTAQANLTVAMAQVKQLQASIQQTQSQHKADTARLGYTRIYAPMAGTVLTIDVKEGQTLNANYQTPALLQIADLSTMRIQAKVSEADIHRIQPGLPVRFNTLGNSERTWHSKVDQVLPAPPKPTAEDSTEARAVTYTVLFDVNNHDGALMPGMTTETDFVVTAANDVPVAPLAALMPESSANGLYLAQVLLPDGNTEQRRINVGRRDRLRVEVLAGLQPGEQMVVSTRKYARRRDSW